MAGSRQKPRPGRPVASVRVALVLPDAPAGDAANGDEAGEGGCRDQRETRWERLAGTEAVAAKRGASTIPGDDPFAPFERRRGPPIGNLPGQCFAEWVGGLHRMLPKLTRIRPDGAGDRLPLPESCEYDGSVPPGIGQEGWIRIGRAGGGRPRLSQTGDTVRMQG